MSGDPHGSHGRGRTHADRALLLRAVSLLRRISAGTNEWQRTEMEHGFTVNQALVLHHLVSHGDATPSELADWVNVTRGTLTPTLKRLEDMGLLTRRADEKDGRKQVLSATEEARKIAPRVEREVLHPVLHTFADWSSKELERFCEDLTRILEGPLFRGRS